MHRILLLLILLAGCALQPVTDPRTPNPENEPTMVPTSIAIEKPTYVVQRGSVTSQLFKSGRITPIDQSHLSFTINGQIASLFANKGSAVQAGDVVAELDTTELEQALQAAEAALSLANEQLAIAQESRATHLRRAEIGVELVQLRLDFALEEAGENPTVEQTLAIELLKRELELAQLHLEEIDSVIDPTLSSQVVQSQLQLDSIKSQIAQSTLVAPISGEVMVVNFAEGDRVTAGETVLVVADLDRVEAQISLLDRDLQALSEGMIASGVIPSQPDTPFSMTVRQLPFPYGTGAQDVEADQFVRISFDDPSQTAALSVGERLEVAILLNQQDGTLWLPPAAVREFNGRRFVVVQDGQTQRRVDIKIGLQNENQIEIVSGVTEGQLVVGP